MFSESLTVRILADSSSFRSELDSVLSLLGRFRESVGTIAGAGTGLVSSFSQLFRALAPLHQISKLLSGIQQQVRAIGQTPLVINVDLAVSALARLSAMIDQVAARLQSLSSIGPPYSGGSTSVGPGGLPGGFAPTFGGPLPGLPEKLSAAGHLPPMASLASSALSVAPTTTNSTTNHFGGITIQVRETADVHALVRDLRLQGIHLRNRRG